MNKDTFSERIRDMIKDSNLQMTMYSKDKAEMQKYKQEQFKKVINTLKELFDEGWNKESLNGINPLLPPNLDPVPIEHIGKSTDMCIQMTKEYIEDSDFKEFALKVLDLIANEVCDFILKESTFTLENEKKFTEQFSGIKLLYDDFEVEYEDWSKVYFSNLEELEDLANTTEKRIREAKILAKDAKKISENIISTVLTVLSIFVAIIIAIVACYLNIILTKQNTITLIAETAENAGRFEIPLISRPLEFMQFLLMGHITISIIFFLMYLVSKMTPFNLACHCSQYERKSNLKKKDDEYEVADCSKCEKGCSIPKKGFLRYPYLCVINIVFILGYVGLATWQFINVYCRDSLNVWILDGLGRLSFPMVCGVAVMVVVVLIVAAVFTRNKKNKP